MSSVYDTGHRKIQDNYRSWRRHTLTERVHVPSDLAAVGEKFGANNPMLCALAVSLQQ